MIAFLWTADDQVGAVASDHIEPLVLVNLSGSADPEAQAETAYAALADKSAGRRALFFRHVLDGLLDGSFQCGDVDIRTWLSTGIGRLDAVKDYFFKFWATFRDQGNVRPDDMFTDEEDGQNITLPATYADGATWADRAASYAKVNNDPFLKRYSPRQLQAYSEADIAAGIDGSWQSSKGRAVQRLYNRSDEILRATIRDAILGTYGTVMGEAAPPFDNYGDEILSREFRGFQNESYFPGARSSGGAFAAPLYLNRYASLPPIFTGQTSEHRWLSFLKHQNHMRCVQNGAEMRPWISYPTFDNLTNLGKYEGWIHNLNATAAMGVERVRLWAPSLQMGTGGVPSLSTQLAAAEAALAAVPSAKITNPERLPLLSYDATTVTIGSWSVTYNASEWGTL